jgi:hypothetical protein
LESREVDALESRPWINARPHYPRRLHQPRK